MPQPDKDSRLVTALASFESAVGIPANFVRDLSTEGDWSFVVKSVALLEAALTHLLATHTGTPALTPVLKQLPFADKKYGKVRMAVAFGLVTPAEEHFMAWLSELRNKLAHDIKRVTFTFESHLAGLDKNQTKQFLNAVASPFIGDLPASLPTTARAHPKEHLWLALEFTRFGGRWATWDSSRIGAEAFIGHR